MKPIYLDHNATTPIDEEVFGAMKPYLREHFGNPSSSHIYGIQTKQAIEKARRQVAKLLNCDPREIVFTSGGTESNNYAIKGIALANKKSGDQIITSAIEHPAVIEVCKYLAANGFRITYLPVDEYGLLNIDDLKQAICSKTILISIMHANNEVGTIQPILEIAELASENRIFFHTDAAQSIGKIAVDLKKTKVDLLSVAGHKLYAPKGIGALFIKQGIELQKLMHGANHEQDRRAGTENVASIVGLGKACEIAARDLLINSRQMTRMRDLLHDLLKKEFPEIKLNGHPAKRLPNTLNISFPNLRASEILFDLDDIAASAGAACHSENIKVSPVLEALDVPLEYSLGAIRFSTGKRTSERDIYKAAEMIIATISKKNKKSIVKIN